MFVIYLDSTNKHSWETNDYGYWTGENYTVSGELFPVTEDKITSRTKRYSSRKRAESALEACLSKGYTYVTTGKIESEG